MSPILNKSVWESVSTTVGWVLCCSYSRGGGRKKKKRIKIPRVDKNNRKKKHSRHKQSGQPEMLSQGWTKRERQRYTVKLELSCPQNPHVIPWEAITTVRVYERERITTFHFNCKSHHPWLPGWSNSPHIQFRKTKQLSEMSTRAANLHQPFLY